MRFIIGTPNLLHGSIGGAKVAYAVFSSYLQASKVELSVKPYTSKKVPQHRERRDRLWRSQQRWYPLNGVSDSSEQPTDCRKNTLALSLHRSRQDSITFVLTYHRQPPAWSTRGHRHKTKWRHTSKYPEDNHLGTRESFCDFNPVQHLQCDTRIPILPPWRPARPWILCSHDGYLSDSRQQVPQLAD
jgi:hypothetical protein